MSRTRSRSAVLIAAVFGFGLAACGSDERESSETEVAEDRGASASEETVEQADAPAADADLPTIVVTTNLLGDVVEQVVGDSAEVLTIMPVGADPHDFQASAQEVDAMNNADALIVNGAAFEEGLLDVIEGAEDEGVPMFEAISAVDAIDFGEGGHSDDDEDGEHGDDEHSDEDAEHGGDDHADEEHGDHGHAGADPHFFTDPLRMATAVDAIVDFLQDEVTFADPAVIDASAVEYVTELNSLDADVANLVESIPEARRVLVTNHEVFGYFAERYGFEVVGAVIPGGSTTDTASAGELAELAEQIEVVGVPAIFADASSADDLVEALADEVGDVAVVELYSESLGDSGSDGASYMEMVRTNAERMSAALA